MEQLAYLQHSLQSSSWSVRLRSLLRRSLLEGSDIHYRIRSLRQLESLVSAASGDDSISNSERYRDFFLALPLPIVNLKLALAKQQEQMLLNSSVLSRHCENRPGRGPLLSFSQLSGSCIRLYHYIWSWRSGRRSCAFRSNLVVVLKRNSY